MERKSQERLRFFAENGVGPYFCYGCERKMVVPWRARKRIDFLVHHLPGGQCVAIHRGCHARLHTTGRSRPGYRHTEDAKRRIGEAGRSTRKTSAVRKHMSDGLRRAWAEGRFFGRWGRPANAN